MNSTQTLPPRAVPHLQLGLRLNLVAADVSPLYLNFRKVRADSRRLLQFRSAARESLQGTLLLLFVVSLAGVCHAQPPTNHDRQAADSWSKPPVTAPHLQQHTFASKTAGTNVSYLIYLPPGYAAQITNRFPVTYWLHGLGGGQQGVPQFCERLTRAIEAGQTPPMLVVFVNGLTQSMWCDSADGKWPVETVFIGELIPHIDATYRTRVTRNGRMIEGFSMGGFGALRLGCKYPELFGAISSISGAIHNGESFTRTRRNILDSFFGGDLKRFEAETPWTWSEQNAAHVKARTLIRIAVGDQDQTRTYNANFHAHLDKLGIAHSYTLIPGAGHSHAQVYDGLGDANWKFYREAFRSLTAAKSP